jgi:hypothetical protein
MGERTDACEARAAECSEAAERAALRGHKPLKRCTWLLPASGKSWPSKPRNWNGSTCVVQSRMARGSMISGSKFFLEGGACEATGIFQLPGDGSARGGECHPGPPARMVSIVAGKSGAA